MIDGKEVVDNNVLAWEKKINCIQHYPSLILTTLKKVTSFINMGDYLTACDMLFDVRRKTEQLKKIQGDEATKDLTQKVDIVETHLFNASKHKILYMQSPHNDNQEAVLTRNSELTLKIVQKIDNMIEEMDRLKNTNVEQVYRMIRECNSRIDKLKYGKNVKDLKQQWKDRLDSIKMELWNRK